MGAQVSPDGERGDVKILGAMEMTLGAKSKAPENQVRYMHVASDWDR
jgi:hypothetical protein